MVLPKKWIVACGYCGCLYHRTASNDKCPACGSNIQDKIEGFEEK